MLCFYLTILLFLPFCYGRSLKSDVNRNNNLITRSIFNKDISLLNEQYLVSHVRHREPKIVKHDRYESSLFEMPLKYCQRPAECKPLNYSFCMGAKLPYKQTTLNLTDLETQEKVAEQLLLFEYVRYVPKCWSIIQPFLCALYMPKCSTEMVNLPSREMCEITMEHCKIFLNTLVFPEILNCKNDNLFPSKCKNDVHEMKFNTTGSCMDPLIKTEKQDWYYPGIEGCGLKCKDSLYTENEHQQIHKLIGYCVFPSILCTFFTIMTFSIEWNTANKYPALAIFYLNVCSFISCLGWSIQFLGPEARDDVVCKRDGTLRKSEPSASENLSCVVVFVMVYYFLIANMVWFVIFCYSWYMTSLQALGKSQERIDKKHAYFHLVAWSLPLILTITTMAVGEIDADYVTGICFISKAARIGLLLIPLTITVIIGDYIIVRGLILLIQVKIDSKEIISAHSSSKIKSNIVRMSAFMIFMNVFGIITFFYHNYLYMHQHEWEESLSEFIFCKLTSFSSDFSHCKQANRPSVSMLQLQLLAVFGASISMASWVWCHSTLHTWGRYIRRKFQCEIEEPIKLQKHRIIAQAFAKRKKFNEGGKISIDCQNHSDPVGLHFDLNSAASNELSTTWAANLPRLVNRRGAVPNNLNYSMSSNNHSIDSEVSVNLRTVSIESRRNSGDSQLSVQIAELKAVRKVNRRHRNNYRHKREYRRKSRRHSRTSKRDSNTSLDSHLQLINALTTTGEIKNMGPNLNRRTANAGLESHHLNNLFTNGKLVIPYSRKNKSGSEDENVSVTISESKFNMVLSNHNNLDLNDQLVIQSLKQQIGEITSSSESDDKKDCEKEKWYSRNRKDSHTSKRSKQSKKKYLAHSCDSSCLSSENSSCPEIKHLVQSSLNSNQSCCEKPNRSSRQSRTSTDVAVQTSIQDIEMKDLDNDTECLKKGKNSKAFKQKENNRKYKKNDNKKEKYKEYGTNEELIPLNNKKHKNQKNFKEKY